MSNFILFNITLQHMHGNSSFYDIVLIEALRGYLQSLRGVGQGSSKEGWVSEGTMVSEGPVVHVCKRFSRRAVNGETRPRTISTKDANQLGNIVY